MARPLRLHLPGKASHVFARGDNKAPIFRTDADHRHFLEIFSGALDRFAIRCIAYCLLFNHYHLLVIPQEHSVSRLMHHVNSDYCRWFNRQHGRVGHVLQGRFDARIVDGSDYLLNVLRYIALNPVAAGLAKRAEDWPWSSYRATAGLCATPEFLTLEVVWKAFGCVDAQTGQSRYVAHVAKEADEGELDRALLLGDDLLVSQARPLLEPHRDDRALLYRDRFAARPPLDAILSSADSLSSLKRAARDAFHCHAYTLREISDMIGRAPSTLSKWIHRVDDEDGQNRATIGRSWHGKLRSDKFKL